MWRACALDLGWRIPLRGRVVMLEAGATPGVCRRVSGSDSGPGMWWPFTKLSSKLTQALDPNTKYLERVIPSSGRKLRPITDVGQHHHVLFHHE